MSRSEPISGPVNEAARFSTTHWSVVLAAGRDSSPSAREALQQLCLAYWYPLYAYVRRQGHTPEDAQDLTQEFFTRFLARNSVRLADRERGRFRTFLLSSLKHFLVDEWKRATREKRGGRETVLSLDELAAETRYASEPAHNESPDALFDKRWAATLMEQTMAKLAAEFASASRPVLFETLKMIVWGEQNKSYTETAELLGMTEGALKVAVHRFRQRYGELLRAEVANTVATPAEIDEEVRYLISALRLNE